MTEKQGGSDVRANTTRAVRRSGGDYLITGHKWFCSAPMSDAFLVLAQVASPGGTDALSCFLVPRVLPDGTRNVFRIQRLKNKLGNRSNASCEVEFDDTVGQLIGEVGAGVRTIIEMVARTRLDCVYGSAAGMRQGVAEVPFVHPQTMPVMNEHYTGCQFDLYRVGHARMLMPGGGRARGYAGKPERTFKGLARGARVLGARSRAVPRRPERPAQALQQRKRELGAAKGYDFSRYSDEQLTDHYHYTVFPNISFSMKPDGCIFLRATRTRPTRRSATSTCGTSRCSPRASSEYWSNSMGDWVSIDHQVEHQRGNAGEVSCGPGIDQDVAIW